MDICRCSRDLLFTSLICACGFGASAQASDIYAVLVFDMDAAGIEKEVAVDRRNMEQVLRGAFAKDEPVGRLYLKVFADNESKLEILKYFSDELPNKVQRDDVVLFYYSGHGGLNEFGRQQFTRSADRKNDDTPLEDFMVYDWMNALPSRLNIMLWDCCAARPQRRPAVAHEMSARLPTPRGPHADHELLNQLFFDEANKHMVIIGSSTPGTLSYCDERLGGVFTSAFVDVLRSKPKVLDKDKNGKVDWSELFAAVKSETTNRQTKQVPRAHFLNEKAGDEYYVEFENTTNHDLTLKYRSYGRAEFIPIPNNSDLGAFKTIEVPEGSTIRLKTRAGRPLRVFAIQYFVDGEARDSSWVLSTNETLADQSEANPIIFNAGISYNTGKDGTALRVKRFRLGKLL